LDELRPFLPIQNPLGVFIHNNMLMNFEDRPFAQGVAEAAHLYGAKRTLKEDYYSARAPRIRKDYLRTELDGWAREQGIPLKVASLPRGDVLWALLHHPLVIPHRSARDTTALQHRVRRLRSPTPAAPPSSAAGKPWKQVIERATGEDINAHFFPVLIRFLAAYVDQGMATWHHPHTGEGLWEGFRAFIESNAALGPSWMKRLRDDWPEAGAESLEHWLAHWLARPTHPRFTQGSPAPTCFIACWSCGAGRAW